MARKLPLTNLEVGSVSPAVLVCGDPDRATKIAAHLSGAELLADWREYRSYRGMYNDTAVTVCSHGIGAPGAAIAFEELIAAGAKIIIRSGSCGGIQPAVQAGDLVIATAAVQATGYGREVAPPGYPAVADPEIVLALRQAGKGYGRALHEGIVLSRDAFYSGVNTPFTPDYQVMAQANVTAVEMECAALFLVGSLRQVPTGAILAVDGNVSQAAESMDNYNPHAAIVQEAVEAEIEMALQALTTL